MLCCILGTPNELINKSMLINSGNIVSPVGETDEVWLHECQPCGLSFDNEQELITHIKLGHVNIEENKIYRGLDTQHRT